MKPLLDLVMRLGRRLLAWLLIGLLIYIIEVPYNKPAEAPYIDVIGVTVWLLTCLVYEVNAHWLFKRYLYNSRWLAFAGSTIGLIALVDFLLWVTFPLVQRVAPPLRVINASDYPYLHTWASIYQAGLLGWATSITTLNTILGTNYFFASPFLTIHLFRHYLAQRRITQQAELNNLSLRSENTMLQLDILKGQINPHFLFNSLNSIYVRVIDVDELAADLVLRLAELMRYNLYEADALSVSLDQELAYIANYLQLEQARYGNRVEIIFTWDDDWTPYRIAPLLLLAFVENAFRLGIANANQEAYVWVEAHIDSPATLVFTVQNSLSTNTTRADFPKKTVENHLRNILQRLASLYPSAHQIETQESVDSYSVTLKLALDKLTTT